MSPSMSLPGGIYGRCDSVSTRFERKECIGKGTYGTVYRACDRATGRSPVIRVLFKSHCSSKTWRPIDGK